MYQMEKKTQKKTSMGDNPVVKVDVSPNPGLSLRTNLVWKEFAPGAHSSPHFGPYSNIWKQLPVSNSSFPLKNGSQNIHVHLFILKVWSLFEDCKKIRQLKM